MRTAHRIAAALALCLAAATGAVITHALPASACSASLAWAVHTGPPRISFHWIADSCGRGIRAVGRCRYRSSNSTPFVYRTVYGAKANSTGEYSVASCSAGYPSRVLLWGGYQRGLAGGGWSSTIKVWVR